MDLALNAGVGEGRHLCFRQTMTSGKMLLRQGLEVVPLSERAAWCMVLIADRISLILKWKDLGIDLFPKLTLRVHDWTLERT